MKRNRSFCIGGLGAVCMQLGLLCQSTAMVLQSASTSASLVAQLVQKRTAVVSSSILAHMLKAYFSRSLSSAVLGKMGNCWLVGESQRKG